MQPVFSYLILDVIYTTQLSCHVQICLQTIASALNKFSENRIPICNMVCVISLMCNNFVAVDLKYVVLVPCIMHLIPAIYVERVIQVVK